MAASAEARRLAARLRTLRDSADRPLTQAQLARALSQWSESSKVAVATISSWENTASPKLPAEDKLRAYALFFCTPRSLDGAPHLVKEADLTASERAEFDRLRRELEELRELARNPQQSAAGSAFWGFDGGRVTIICPDAPRGERSQQSDARDPNFTRMYRYADLDALIELYGHLRSVNPDLRVDHRLASEVVADDLSGHVVLLGGIAWNPVTRRLLSKLQDLPVAQIVAADVPTGEIFRAEGTIHRPQWEPWQDGGEGQELIEDVALLVRLANPFNHSRTLTMCNGVHSRGVLGAVRCLTDVEVRERNEEYLGTRFPRGAFAALMRIPVLQGEALSPDLTIPDTLLYEWSPPDEPAS